MSANPTSLAAVLRNPQPLPRTLHPPATCFLAGLGKVGKALLEAWERGDPPLALGFSLRGAADRRGVQLVSGEHTVECLLAAKSRAAPIHSLSAAPIPLGSFAQMFPWRYWIDCTSSEAGAAETKLAQNRTLLRAGVRVVLAEKCALELGARELLDPPFGARLGINAVLGGTGLRFQQALPALREEAVAATIVGNASTTCIIEAVEAGATFKAGLKAARAAGYLESDPTLDLNGSDALTKARIVAGALFRLDFAELPIAPPIEALTQLDPKLLRRRRARGNTTRLVARVRRDEIRIAYEEVPRLTALAPPPGRVAYIYDLRLGGRVTHIGGGVGPAATAAAVREDLLRLLRTEVAS